MILWFLCWLQDAINSASSMAQTLSGELADGQRKLLAVATAGTNTTSMNSMATQLGNGPFVGLNEKVCPHQKIA